MYNFIDVTEASEGFVLPSEAMKINGQYIEDLISGYRTLSVSGREALSPDVGEFEVGIRDGSALEKKRYPSRIIIVNYMLTAESNEAFRNAFNQLGKILDVKNAELIFNDEQDKFFIGTPCIIDSVTPGLNSVVGKFEILCTDPFKYSVVEYEATASLDDPSVLVDYNGTYKAYPKLHAEFYNETEVAEDGETAVALTGAGDCGYVAFFDEKENIVQFGDPTEVDGVTAYEKSQTLMNQLFTGEFAWGDTAKSLWGLNNGNVLADAVQTGDVHMGVASRDYSVNAGTTSARIGTKVASGSPSIWYTITAKTSKRTADSVYVQVTVSAMNMSKTENTPNGLYISAGVTIAGVRKDVVVRGAGSLPIFPQCSVSASFGLTISGLTQSQTSLTNSSFFTSTNLACGKVSASALNDIPISKYSVSVSSTHYLCPLGYSIMSGKWHGPSITRTIGADASGEVGARDFTLTYEQKMCIGNTSNAANQFGAFQVQLNDASGANVCGVRIHKNLSGKQASMLFYVGGEKVHGEMIDLSYNNKNFGAAKDAVRTSTITKSNGTIKFTVAGVTKTFNVDSVAESKVEKVTFMFEQWSNDAALEYNGLYWAKFVKNNCNTYRDIPNKFSANDVLVADCRDARIFLNGIERPDLGAIGNDWEAFCLTPGLNQIGVAYSEWVDVAHAPTFKVKYREVFL